MKQFDTFAQTQLPLSACSWEHFDIAAACTGFLYGLHIANMSICSGRNRTILLVATEVASRVVDWTDRSTCVLFGDGAGAAVIQTPQAGESAGILASVLMSVPDADECLSLPALGAQRHIGMRGNEVFRHAVRLMSDAASQSLLQCGLTPDDVDLFIPHQANERIIHATADAIGIPRRKTVCSVSRHANTGSASIPLALDAAWDQNLIKENTTVLLTAIGGGFTVGGAVVRF